VYTTPGKIHIVSTDISEPGGSSVLGEQFQLERSEDQEFSDHAMSPTLERSAAKSNLRLLDTKVRDMCNDLSWVHHPDVCPFNEREAEGNNYCQR
jgi:hypothetical protein